MNWLKENWFKLLLAYLVGFVFASGVYFLFGEIGLAIFLVLYFIVFLPWLKRAEHILWKDSDN